MASVSLNKELYSLSTHWYAMEWDCSIADLVEDVPKKFVGDPQFLLLRAPSKGVPSLPGPRHVVWIPDALFDSTARCARSLEMSIDELVDLAIVDRCSARTESLLWSHRT